MCRNIKPLFNFDPPATDAEIHDAALQFVRKLSGMNAPAQRNRKSFDLAVTKVSAAARQLIDSMTTDHEPKNRETECAKARARSADRFAKPPLIVFE